ncbi:Bax inhibitor-1/YccA family protein [Candidatus Similichlamydia laticola]|uniref:Transport permease n=1 Tax=Candidatus Similichlamydia laticola TaxID=2170265 RepID=A0A369KJZ3_9BACT|nr:Bax inhibitor-1 family protein [Candidatus Similichlamydia laticola]RDB31306.1 transport permease [Candidatus Similichlamydia laticola]
MRLGEQHSNQRHSFLDKAGTFASYVYGWVAAGLAITASVAYGMYATGLYVKVASLWWVWTAATLGISLYIRYNLERLSAAALSTCFVVYSICEGFFFGSVLPLFVRIGYGSAVWVAFCSASAMFIASALYGRYTRSDLTNLGVLLSFALMGFVGLTLLSVVFSFFGSVSSFQLILAYCGLALFMGLTMFEAQKIQEWNSRLSMKDGGEVHKLALMAALGMYANLITMFWYALRILSHDRDR